MEFQYKNRGFDLKKNFEIEPSLGMGMEVVLTPGIVAIDEVGLNL